MEDYNQIILSNEMIKFIFGFNNYSMNNIRIEDLSAIQQRKIAEEGIDQSYDNKRKSQLFCPITSKQNYQCPICNRLRKVCPWSKIEGCQHSQSYLNVRNDASWNSKGGQSTMLNDRLKTFSTIQSRNQSGSLPDNVYVSASRFNGGQSRERSGQKVAREGREAQTQEIIFYPVIHNKLISTPSRSAVDTPERRSRNQRFCQVEEDTILTPTQFKQMMESFRF